MLGRAMLSFIVVNRAAVPTLIGAGGGFGAGSRDAGSKSLSKAIAVKVGIVTTRNQDGEAPQLWDRGRPVPQRVDQIRN